ncbi:hypothetical protein ABPG72_016168, partial [Tetrahymena utriculariae]
MDKQNILSQEQQGIESTQNLLALNQLNEKQQYCNQNQYQLSSPNNIKEFDNKCCNMKNKEKSLNVKGILEEDVKQIQKKEIYQTDEKQLEEKINETQIEQYNVIKDIQNEVNSSSMCNQNQYQLSSPNNIKKFDNKCCNMKNKEKSLNVKDILEEDVKQIQKKEIYQTDEKQLEEKINETQIDEYNVIKDIQNQVNSSSMRKDQYLDLTLQKKVLSQLRRDFFKNRKYQKVMLEGQIIKDAQHEILTYENEEIMSYLQYLISLQNLNDTSIQLKNLNENSQTENTHKKGKQKNKDILESLKQDNKMDVITKSIHKSKDQEDQSLKDTSTQQDIQKKSNQSQIKIMNEIEKQNELTESYATLIKKMLDQFEEYKQQENINENEYDQESFEKNNINSVQSEAFQNQKAKIFQKLNENQFYLSKILASDNNQTLILGILKKKEQKFAKIENTQGCTQDEDSLIQMESQEDIIFKIIHYTVNPEISCLIQILQTLQVNFENIEIEQENIFIFILKKSDYVQIYNKFELLTQFKSGIQQLNNYSELNSNTLQNCKQCEKQITCKNYECFKNIKTRILDFLKNQNYLYYEWQFKQIERLIFYINQEELIESYNNFALKLIYSFLKSEQVTHQSLSNQAYFNQKASDNSLERSISIFASYLDLSKFQFEQYLYPNKLDLNGGKVLDNSKKRQWDIIKFYVNIKNDASRTFQNEQNVIIPILIDKKYYLCKIFFSDDQEDLFFGYQKQNKDTYLNCVFAIKYYPPSLEIQKYLMIQQLNEETNHFIINDWIHIFILPKDTFNQFIQYLSDIQNMWTKDYFEKVNKDKILNQKS